MTKKECRVCGFWNITEGRCQAVEFGEATPEQIEAGCKDVYYKDKIGVYGRKHERFLKETDAVKYEDMVFENRLEDYLIEVNKRAREILWKMIDSYVKEHPITTKDTLEKARIMNNIKDSMEEIVLRDIVYQIYE